MLRKSSIAAAVIAAATAGSALFSGVALAGAGDDITNTGGNGGNASATNNCVNVGVPILSGIAVGGTASATGAHCTANATGGAGGAGALVD